MNMKMEHTNRSGDIIEKSVPITKQADEEIAHTLLHEIGHLYFGERYGYRSKQYSDENACNVFASRWIRVLRKEKLL